MPKKRSNGEGSIFFESSLGLWTAEIYLPDGTKKRKRSKFQSKVNDWLIKERELARKGLTFADGQMSFSVLLDRYLQDVAAHTLKPKTLHSYTYLIETHIRPSLGRYRLSQIKPEHVQALYTQKLDSGLSRRTVAYIHSLIRRVFNLAVKWELVYRNPTASVTPPAVVKKAPVTFSEGTARQVLSALKGHQWYPIYVLAITTGMRIGEILGLEWEDMDLERGIINVRHSMVYISGRIERGDTKTDASRRTIVVPESALKVLKGYLPTIGKGLVFTTRSGKPISARNILRHFHSTLETLGLPKIPFHNLRHTAATFLLQEGVHPKVVQEILGHSSISLTLDTYSHVMPNIQTEAAKKMNNLLGEL